MIIVALYVQIIVLQNFKTNGIYAIQIIAVIISYMIVILTVFNISIIIFKMIQVYVLLIIVILILMMDFVNYVTLLMDLVMEYACIKAHAIILILLLINATIVKINISLI